MDKVTVKEVTEGSDCKRLMTIQECENGAKSLGLSCRYCTSAKQIEADDLPKNCFYRA